MKETDTASYTDHNTPYVSVENIGKLISSLEGSSRTLFKCFADNCVEAKADICYLLVSGTQKANVKMCQATVQVRNFNESNLAANRLLMDLCKITSRKLNAQARIAPNINISEVKILMKTFLRSQFNYCPVNMAKKYEIWCLIIWCNNVEAFKQNIRTWKLCKCPCKLCKVYLNNIGFL